MKKRVLFICHGNICRSPMAEFYMKKLVKDQGLELWFEIASAATSDEECWNGIGNPVYGPAKDELAKHGIRCDGKRARQMTKADYDYYDYLICMEPVNVRNLRAIIGADPQGKVSLLLDHCGRVGEAIADPWYCGHFDRTYRDIAEGCDGLLRELIATSDTMRL